VGVNGETEATVVRELARLATDMGPALVPADHDELLRSIIAAARGVFEATACSLALLDEGQEELVFHMASGGAEQAIVGMRVPVGSGIAGWVVTSGQPIAIQDAARDPRFARDIAESLGYVPNTILAMPLETDREIIGAIEVLDPRGGGPGGASDLELLSLFARQAALAIESSRVFSELGRALFTAAARVAEDRNVVAALELVARESAGPDPELAELAARFAELGRLGLRERAAATRLLEVFLAYLRGRPGR
jgi:GAF domain-containing protein